jgi:23S rRNA (cytidine1920-2'-O)/16S rRNA (cytidine1409-2'-O)-methyltransferase
MSEKIRADQRLVDLGLAETRERAKRLIMAGLVIHEPAGQDGEPVAKPGQQIPAESRLRLKDRERYVSRGGYKLETALNHFNLHVRGWVALDVGASTGGFTDCLLQWGAERVYAVDVGYGQLHWSLRNHPGVINLERVNMRHAQPDLLPEPVDVAVVDCSFISLRRILPPVVQFLRPAGLIITLVKPQFEVERGQAAKGVVRSRAHQEEAIQQVVGFARMELGLEHLGWVASAVQGPKGNQEYLACFRLPGS